VRKLPTAHRIKLVRAPGLEPGTGSNLRLLPKETLITIRKILSNQAQIALDEMKRGGVFHTTQFLSSLCELSPEFSTFENNIPFSTLENPESFQLNSCKTEENPLQSEQKVHSKGRRG
jgi:hypothetical protein